MNPEKHAKIPQRCLSLYRNAGRLVDIGDIHYVLFDQQRIAACIASASGYSMCDRTESPLALNVNWRYPSFHG